MKQKQTQSLTQKQNMKQKHILEKRITTTQITPPAKMDHNAVVYEHASQLHNRKTEHALNHETKTDIRKEDHNILQHAATHSNTL